MFPFGRDFVIHNGLRLPTRRSNEGLKSAAAYMASIREQIKPLEPFLHGARILDFGCGQGRLLNGLKAQRIQFREYVGTDVDATAIAWCCRNLSSFSGPVAFVWYNAANERYNPEGISRTSIPRPDNSCDFVFCNSVFSHMLEPDVRFYLSEFHRVLTEGGHAYLTAFAEDCVDPCTINPPGYFGESNSPLHRVRYERGHLCSLIESHGFIITEFRHRGIERTGQSEFLLGRQRAR